MNGHLLLKNDNKVRPVNSISPWTNLVVALGLTLNINNDIMPNKEEFYFLSKQPQVIMIMQELVRERSILCFMH